MILATPYLLTAADAPVPQGLPTVDPAAAGMDGEKLAGISAAMQKFVDEGQLAGAVTLVARRGHVAHLAAVGQADLESRSPMTPESLFVIASMTKPITATAVMILQDEGKLSVDDPVTKYIPEFAEAKLASGPPNRPITLKDLMTHTSGVGGEQRTERSLQETVAAIIKRPLLFEPGPNGNIAPACRYAGESSRWCQSVRSTNSWRSVSFNRWE